MPTDAMQEYATLQIQQVMFNIRFGQFNLSQDK